MEPPTSRFLNDWECEFCCKNEHCGKCYCCVNYMNELAKKRGTLYTVLAENVMLNKETGYPCKFGFVLYSSPCIPSMAKALASQIRMCNRSYRIMEKDGKGKIVEQWWRKGFIPDDKRDDCLLNH